MNFVARLLILLRLDKLLPVKRNMRNLLQISKVLNHKARQTTDIRIPFSMATKDCCQHPATEEHGQSHDLVVYSLPQLHLPGAPAKVFKTVCLDEFLWTSTHCSNIPARKERFRCWKTVAICCYFDLFCTFLILWIWGLHLRWIKTNPKGWWFLAGLGGRLLLIAIFRLHCRQGSILLWNMPIS